MTWTSWSPLPWTSASDEASLADVNAVRPRLPRPVGIGSFRNETVEADQRVVKLKAGDASATSTMGSPKARQLGWGVVAAPSWRDRLRAGRAGFHGLDFATDPLKHAPCRSRAELNLRCVDAVDTDIYDALTTSLATVPGWRDGMDFFYVGLAVVFFALTWAFVNLCDRV
jgi:hypothetical protein